MIERARFQRTEGKYVVTTRWDDMAGLNKDKTNINMLCEVD